jgi:hypothetical protein
MRLPVGVERHGSPKRTRRFMMRGVAALTALLAIAAALAIALPSASASAKFNSTAVVADSGDLVVQFEEGALRRFAAVDYRLVGDAIAQSPTLAVLHEGVTASIALIPDERGRVAGGLTLDIPTSADAPCGCGSLHIEYFNLTLTNLTSGRTYRLDPVSRDFPG